MVINMPIRKPKKRASLPPVSLGNIAYEETLPLPWVKYPNHYGTFFIFSEDQNGTYYFCRCNETLLVNLLELNKQNQPGANIDPRRMAVIDSLNVPDEIAEIALKNPKDPISALKFKRNLCHRCNFVHPTLRYCHEMYGGKFDQSFGWYVNQSYLRYGVDPWSKIYFLQSICPDEIQELIKSYAKTSSELIAEIDKQLPPDRSQEKELRKNNNKAHRELKNTFINFTREEFGFRKVGECWVSETIVFKIVGAIFPYEEIIRHHRPEWLENLELDIYIPNLQLGIEYQGQQHFKPIKAWGGEKALKGVQERDQKKATICKIKGVTLVHINYTDPLTKSFIASVLKEKGIKT